MSNRAWTPGEPEKTQPVVLAFLPDWTEILLDDYIQIAGVSAFFPVYKFDTRHPNSAKRYGVETLPTFIVQLNAREIWRTNKLPVLLEGLDIKVDW